MHSDESCAILSGMTDPREMTLAQALWAMLYELERTYEDWPPADIPMLHKSLEVMRHYWLPTLPPPHSVLLPSGGLQLEWHDKGVDVEIEFRGESWIPPVVLVAWGDGENETICGSLLDEDAQYSFQQALRCLAGLRYHRPAPTKGTRD